MQVPTPEDSTPSKIHLIGGEKGGVGKSMVSRLLAQYFIDQQLSFVGFDTDRSHGALLRFYADYASPLLVDRYEALDRIIERAAERPGQRVLVDLAAQTDAPLMKWMEESGVLEMSDHSGFELHYWHVMDTGRDSVTLLSRLLDRFGQRLRHVIVMNQLRGDDFGLLKQSGELARAQALGARVITIKRLHDAAVQKMDAHDRSFWAAKSNAGDGSTLGLMDRQRLKIWLGHAFTEIGSVQP